VLFLALIVAAGFAVEAAMGFGATLVVVSLGSLLMPTDAVLFRVVPLNAVLSAAVVLRARGSVDLRALGLRILPAMLVGLPFGFYALRELPPRGLRLVFAAFVLTLAIVELSSELRQRSAEAGSPARSLSLARTLFLLFLGGVAHGALASGGPPVVYVAARTLPDKATFRATLSALWLVLNVALVAFYVADGRVSRGTLRDSFPLVPALAVGLGLGEVLHGRVSERAFRVAVFVMLLVVAAVLAARA
jgi:uncharacterized membrane protein YfcA